MSRSTMIKELFGRYRRGELTLTPFANVVIYAAKEDAIATAATDPNALLTDMQRAIRTRGIHFSTANLISPGISTNNVGVIDNLSVDIHHIFGATFKLQILDTEGGIQINKFIEKVSARGKRAITSYCQIDFGWITSTSEKMQSEKFTFMVNDITAELQGGNFFYTLTGSVIPIPYLKETYITGKFKGTVGEALDSWSKKTGIIIENKNVINLHEKIATPDNILVVENYSPLKLLKKILSYAHPAKKKDRAKPINQNVDYIIVGTKELTVKLRTYSTAVYKIYESYTIGNHDSLVLDFAVSNNLALSKVTENYNQYQLNSKTMTYQRIGDDVRTKKGVHSSVISPETNVSAGEEAKQTANPTRIIDDYNKRTGTMTVVGDPQLIPSNNPNMRTYAFYTTETPFLGIDIQVRQPKPMNVIVNDSTEPISTKHWLDGIYQVNQITHEINAESYTTTMAIQSDLLTVVQYKPRG